MDVLLCVKMISIFLAFGRTDGRTDGRTCRKKIEKNKDIN